MNTSSRFAFAVHVLALLSLQEGTPLSSEMIAGSVNTNPALIRRLLTMLAEAGLTRQGADTDFYVRQMQVSSASANDANDSCGSADSRTQ